MAAAEGDCGVGADADRELEELLESKPVVERPEEGGCEDPFRALSEPEMLGAERGRSSQDWTGAVGLTATVKSISWSPFPGGGSWGEPTEVPGR